MKKLLAAIMIFSLLAVPCSAHEDKQALPIVMYHHISRNPRRLNDYVISVEEFENDLIFLKENGYHTISVRNLISWSRGESEMPEKPCMITLDDGFESTLSYAEPLLEKYGFTAVCAVIGSVCSRFAELDEHYPEVSNMSWQDAAQMAERGNIEIQCHTWKLHALSSRKGCARRYGESATQYDSVLRSDLQKFLDTARQNGVNLTMSIAYPYGEYGEQTNCIARSLGFKAAFNCTEKVNYLNRDPDALFELCRFNRPHGISSENFFTKWSKAIDNAQTMGYNTQVS